MPIIGDPVGAVGGGSLVNDMPLFGGGLIKCWVSGLGKCWGVFWVWWGRGFWPVVVATCATRYQKTYFYCRMRIKHVRFIARPRVGFSQTVCPQTPFDLSEGGRMHIS